MIGIKELADRLDISIGTVSRALNNKPDVNAETRIKVLDAAKRFGYVANQSGRALRRGATNTIGLILSINSQAVNNTDNFVLGLTEGIQSVLVRHNLDLIILPCPSVEQSADFMRRVIARRFVDGLIVTGIQPDDKRLPLLNEAKVPFVSLGSCHAGANFSWIGLDFASMIRTSIDRLVESGHQKIGILVPKEAEPNIDICLQAYDEALRAHGIAMNQEYICRASRDEKGGYHSAGQILKCMERPTAMLLPYEIMAEGFCRRLKEKGIVPGQDLAIIGFRDQSKNWNIVPSLTSFKVDVFNLGSAVGRQLLSQMPDYAPTYKNEPFARVWPMELVPGESDPPLWRSGT